MKEKVPFKGITPSIVDKDMFFESLQSLAFSVNELIKSYNSLLEEQTSHTESAILTLRTQIDELSQIYIGFEDSYIVANLPESDQLN